VLGVETAEGLAFGDISALASFPRFQSTKLAAPLVPSKLRYLGAAAVFPHFMQISYVSFMPDPSAAAAN